MSSKTAQNDDRAAFLQAVSTDDNKASSVKVVRVQGQCRGHVTKAIGDGATKDWAKS